MAVTQINAVLNGGTQLTTSLVTLYTSSAKKTIVDKFTVTNTTGSAATFTLHRIPSGGTASNANMLIPARSVNGGAIDLVPELVGHSLEAGDFLQALASAGATLTVMASGRQITGSP